MKTFLLTFSYTQAKQISLVSVCEIFSRRLCVVLALAQYIIYKYCMYCMRPTVIQFKSLNNFFKTKVLLIPTNSNICVKTLILLIYKLFHGTFMEFFPGIRVLDIISYIHPILVVLWEMLKSLGFWKPTTLQLILSNFNYRGLNVTMFAGP